MRENRLGGSAMIAGAIMGLLTMALHPGGIDDTLRTPLHAFAMMSMPFAFYGALVLTRQLSSEGTYSELALVFYAAAMFAGVIAASASGLLLPLLGAKAATLEGPPRMMYNSLMWYNISLNQVFAKVMVGASSVAIGLWSIDMVQTARMRRRVAIYGCTIAVMVFIVLVSGWLKMDIHGFGGVVLLQGIWLILVGAELRGTPPSQATPRDAE